MEDWKKRAAILIAIGLTFGVVLFVVKSIRTDDGEAPHAPEPAKIAAETAPPPPISRPAESGPAESRPTESSEPTSRPSPPVITPTPPEPRPRGSEERRVPPRSVLRQLQNAQSLYEAMGGNAPQIAAFRALFRPPGSQNMDETTRPEVEIFVREYLGQYRSYLSLSDSDHERLIDLVVLYRKNDLLLRSTRRSAENREMLRALRAEMMDAMDEFKEISDPRPEDIFGTQTSVPPPFGR